MINKFHEVSPGFEIQAWVNVLPPGAPQSMIVDDYDYTAYAAKAFVLDAARKSGATIAILLDAAFYPIRRIHPLVEFIARHKYYFCRNGYQVGEWASDKSLENFLMERRAAFQIPEISSYCVGLNFTDDKCISLLDKWCCLSNISGIIAGPHSAPGSGDARNQGFVSTDPRVRGHRHDQTLLSVLASWGGMTRMVDRPKFTSYLGHESEETVLVNHGGL